MLPATLLIVLLIIYPMFYAIWLSFRDQYILLRGFASNFIGLDNYLRMLGDKTWLRSLGITLFYMVGSVAGEVILGTIFALLLNRKMKFRWIFRSIILMPWVMPPVAVAITWRWILDGQWGILNRILMSLGIIQKEIVWLVDQRFLWFWVLCVSWWKFMPFSYVNLLAGLQAIPNTVLEAATIDGTNRWQRLRLIVLPLLKPVFVVVILLRMIWNSQTFSILWALTKGGPQQKTLTLPLKIYMESFHFFRTSYGATLGVSLLIVMFFLSFLYMKRLYD